MVDRNDLMRAEGGEANLQHVMAAASGMQHHAPSAFAMGVDQLADRCADAGLNFDRLDDQVTLPRAILRFAPMLRGAAAADAEMWAERRDAVRARCFDMQEMPPVGMARNRVDLYCLARERIRHEDRAIRRLRYAVAAMADAIDNEFFSHGLPKAKIPGCRCRPSRGKG